MNLPQGATKFATWAVLELMGHVRMGGFVSEETRFGVAMVRIDVPPTSETAADGFTRYFGASAIYSVSPVSEAAARAVSLRNRGEPVAAWEFPQEALQAIANRAEPVDDEGMDPDGFYDEDEDGGEPAAAFPEYDLPDLDEPLALKITTPTVPPDADAVPIGYEDEKEEDITTEIPRRSLPTAADSGPPFFADEHGGES